MLRINKTVWSMLLLVALSFNVKAQIFTSRGSAQVLYPTVPDYHAYPIVPMETAPLVTFDSPQAPVRVPTLPPNGAHGMEHQSAFVIPVPRVITQQKLDIIQPSTTTTIATDGLTRSATRIMTTITPGTSIVHPMILEPAPRGVPSRFMTTIPTISYSDELPVTVTITISP